MKKLVVLSALCMVAACNNNNTQVDMLKADIAKLQAQNDSLQKEIEAVKPGLGDLMLDIQIHHNKLWFAGKNNDWPLAQFEHNEIMELLKQAETIETDRKEVKLFPAMIYPQLDSLQDAIKQKDSKMFEEKFSALTNACNNCHKAVNYPFNQIEIPSQPPFTNQDFIPNK